MEIKKREDIPENRQVRLTVAVDRGTWQEALMHCYNGIKALCPVEGEPTREKIEAVYGSDFLYQEAVNETYPQALVEAADEALRALAGEKPIHQESSTDANIPLSLGIPANTIGTIDGGSAHTRQEWVDIASLPTGLKIVLGLMLEYQKNDCF